MRTDTPESYKPGVEFLQSSSTRDLVAWLSRYLAGGGYELSGQREDIPVQAILNHIPYLSVQAEARLLDALYSVVLSWRESPMSASPSFTTALFELLSEITSEEILGAMRTFAASVEGIALDDSVRSKLLRSIASVASTRDADYWVAMSENEDDFGGLAFQVLARIAPIKAFDVLPNVWNNDTSRGTVTRLLPELISRFPIEQQKARTSAVLDLADRAPPYVQQDVEASLRSSGLVSVSVPANDQLAHFVSEVRQYARRVKRSAHAIA